MKKTWLEGENFNKNDQLGFLTINHQQSQWIFHTNKIVKKTCIISKNSMTIHDQVTRNDWYILYFMVSDLTEWWCK